MEYLNGLNISIMPWPPYSPDLSPIENLWAITKKRLHRSPIVSREDLKTKLHDIWINNTDIQRACQTLIEGLPRRIQTCIDARGRVLKYKKN